MRHGIRKDYEAEINELKAEIEKLKIENNLFKKPEVIKFKIQNAVARKIAWNVTWKDVGERSSTMYIENWQDAQDIYEVFSKRYDEVMLISVETITDIQEKNFDGEPTNFLYL